MVSNVQYNDKRKICRERLYLYEIWMRVLPSLGGISNILESIPACLTPVTLSTNLLYIYVFGLSKAPFKLKKEI